MYSLGIPVRNEEKTIESLIHSIFEQSLPPEEVLVCVNNSSDRTINIVENLANQYDNLRVLQSAPWKARGWNKIIQETRNKVNIFCDWDIRFWNSETLEKLFYEFQEAEDLKMLWASVIQLPSKRMTPYKLTIPSWQLYVIDKEKIWVNALPEDIINDDWYIVWICYPHISVTDKAFFYCNKPNLIDVYKTQMRILKWVRQLLDMWMEEKMLSIIEMSKKKTKYKLLLELAKILNVKNWDNLWKEARSTKKEVELS